VHEPSLQASKLLKMHTCNTQLNIGMVSDPPMQLKERMCRIKARYAQLGT